MVRLFSDSLSLLNNRKSLYIIHEKKPEPQNIYETPPCKNNLLVFIDGRLTFSYRKTTDTTIAFAEPIVSQEVVCYALRTGGDYLQKGDNVYEKRQLYHGQGSPNISGKVDDYFLDIESDILYNYTEDGWVAITQKGNSWLSFEI